MKQNHFFSSLLLFFTFVMSAYANSEFILAPYDTCKPYDGLIDNKDGTLTDPRNDLVWSRCDLGTKFIKGKGCVGKEAPMNWISAMKKAKEYRSDNHSNWRLPTKAEVMQITDSYANCTRYGSYQQTDAAAVDLRMLSQQYYDSSHYIVTLDVSFVKAWGGSFRMFPQPLRVGFNPMNASGDGIDENHSKTYVRFVRKAGPETDDNLIKANELYVKYIDEPAAKANQERLARNANEDAREAMEVERKKKLNAAKE